MINHLTSSICILVIHTITTTTLDTNNPLETTIISLLILSIYNSPFFLYVSGLNSFRKNLLLLNDHSFTYNIKFFMIIRLIKVIVIIIMLFASDNNRQLTKRMKTYCNMNRPFLFLILILLLLLL